MRPPPRPLVGAHVGRKERRRELAEKGGLLAMGRTTGCLSGSGGADWTILSWGAYLIANFLSAHSPFSLLLCVGAICCSCFSLHLLYLLLLAWHRFYALSLQLVLFLLLFSCLHLDSHFLSTSRRSFSSHLIVVVIVALLLRQAKKKQARLSFQSPLSCIKG